RTRQVVHVEDLLALPDHAQGGLARIAGARTLLIVPLLREQELVGHFGIYRQEVRPFVAKQIELVENFAAQAVIANENARLVKELRQGPADVPESLQQQTASSEVLRIISSSPGQLEPVFQVMLESALKICEAKFGPLLMYDGQRFHAAALHNLP